MKITYYGHSCFMIEMNDTKILFDPFITPNEAAVNVDPTSIKPDFILLSHGHQDHVADVVSVAHQSGATVVAAYEIIGWLGEQGVENLQPLNHGGTVQIGSVQAKFVNAVHSSVLPDGTYGGNPGGFVVWDNDQRFYYAGDTALHMDMQLIPRWGKLDVAFLPIGDLFTMGIEDAVEAAKFVECKRVIGMHYDTFPPIIIDHEQAIESFKENEIELILMNITETKNL